MLNPDDFKRAIRAIDALGATPAVLVKVAELAKDPNTDITTICEFLRNDGPLTAEIISLSNSPYYAPAELHTNLPSAIGFVGMREALRLVNLSLARKIFARDLPGYGLSAHDYWSASVAAATVMEALAGETGLSTEDAHTVGILHAIGRVLINRVIDERGYSVYWDGEQPIEAWERNAVGCDYAAAGAMLLMHWNFPSTMCDVICWQLVPERVTQPVSLLGALQFTKRLLALTGTQFENQDCPIPDTDPFVNAAGLTAESLAQLVATCREEFQGILQSVDLKP